ncbi:KEOPS complex subunit Pcc1 [Halobiforma nitratireducens]|uniref:KEOPS complex Pcc1-like subunit n=1 Tax=Halobiforma nitratireducens JCM 10879 TaxID=1227454 RepID=M0LTE2_9EURY|nr:KEOPS complex subunit Pcc1 [Halobiforma nitratireducens]EMA36827.1 hypothetical protein C446_11097 [Halobiforma nitratireducens JCM 10879]
MRRATIRTDHDDPELLARALEPDNTAEMETTVAVDDGETETSADGTPTLVTRIERETTSGLQSTVDDYVVNLDVAIDIAATGAETATDSESDPEAQHRQPTDAGPASDSEPEHTTNNE